FVDGDRGDADQAVNGEISVNYAVPTQLALSVKMTGVPTTWTSGVPLTLGSEIGGALAKDATLLWQVYYFPLVGQISQVATGNDPTFTFTPTGPGTYDIAVSALSSDFSSFVVDEFLPTLPENPVAGVPPIAQFVIAGVPTDLITGHSFTGK